LLAHTNKWADGFWCGIGDSWEGGIVFSAITAAYGKKIPIHKLGRDYRSLQKHGLNLLFPLFDFMFEMST